MMTTDPEHGTREWSEDPVGDLMKMRQIIIDSFEKMQSDSKTQRTKKKIFTGHWKIGT